MPDEYRRVTKVWTEDDRQRALALLADHSVAEVAAIIGCHENVIYRWLRGSRPRGVGPHSRGAPCPCGKPKRRGTVKCRDCTRRERRERQIAQLLDAIRAWAAEHARPPAAHEWNEARQHPTVSSAVNWLGSWSAAIEAAGFDPRQRMRDRTWSKRAPRTHCVHGHPFTKENTYLTPDGRRQCRECVRAAARRYREKA